GFQPSKPLTVLGFLEEAKKMGYQGVQLCENLNYAELSNDELKAVKKKADELGLLIELGMRDVTRENILLHLEIAEEVSSDFLRIVLGPSRLEPEKDRIGLRERAICVLKDILPRLRATEIRV